MMPYRGTEWHSVLRGSPRIADAMGCPCKPERAARILAERIGRPIELTRQVVMTMTADEINAVCYAERMTPALGRSLVVEVVQHWHRRRSARAKRRRRLRRSRRTRRQQIRQLRLFDPGARSERN